LLSVNDVEELFGLKDAIIKNIENFPNRNEIHVHFELKRHEFSCPACRQLSAKIHDYRTQIIKGPYFGKDKVIFHYRKRRYICPYCGKRFYEPNSFVSKHQRVWMRPL